MPFINSLCEFLCWPLFKLSKNLNIVFNEVINNDVTYIFVKRLQKPIGDTGLNFATLVDCFPFRDFLFPYKLCVCMCITFHGDTSTPLFYYCVHYHRAFFVVEFQTLSSIISTIRLQVPRGSIQQQTSIRWRRVRYHTCVCSTTFDMTSASRYHSYKNKLSTKCKLVTR